MSQCKVALGFDAMSRNGLKSQYLIHRASELIYFLYPSLEQPLLVLSKFLFVLSGPSLAMSYSYTSCHTPGNVIELENIIFISH